VLGLEKWMEIRSLHREGHPIKEIARQTGQSSCLLKGVTTIPLHKGVNFRRSLRGKFCPITGRVLQRAPLGWDFELDFGGWPHEACAPVRRWEGQQGLEAG
jgi:hypothetical protein